MYPIVKDAVHIRESFCDENEDEINVLLRWTYFDTEYMLQTTSE